MLYPRQPFISVPTWTRASIELQLLAMLVLLATLGAPRRLYAQGGVIGGTVYRDTLYHQLTQAEIALPALNRRTVSNYAGDFRFTNVPAGRYAVVVRHLGFAPLTATVVVADNAPVDREYIMAVQAVELDSVRVSATSRHYLSPLLNAFVERERNHNGGYFVGDSLLRDNESRTLQDLLSSRIPGVHSYRPDPRHRPTFEYLSSGRGPNIKSSECPVLLYLNGVIFYNPVSDRDLVSMPDFNALLINQYAGVEYYPGGGSVPAQYNLTGNGCGVLLLWTRER